MPERPDYPDDRRDIPDPQSPLSPADDARIQRLLADARHTEPMPAHVVARFDGVLADLHARRTEERPAPVVDLASRRRRTAASLLVAAAAVVVAGVGLGQIIPNGGDDQGPTAAADQSVQEQEAGGDAAAGAAKGSDSPEFQSASPSAEAPTDRGQLVGEVAIRSGHFDHDVREARKALQQAQPDAITEFGAPPSSCASGITGEGAVVAATYDGAAAALVLRPPAGDVQVVELYLCETTEPVRSITLTVP
jgi:hypothetical protein